MDLYGILLKTGALLLTWLSNYMSSNVWGEITYAFLNLHGCTV